MILCATSVAYLSFSIQLIAMAEIVHANNSDGILQVLDDGKKIKFDSVRADRDTYYVTRYLGEYLAFRMTEKEGKTFFEIYDATPLIGGTED